MDGKPTKPARHTGLSLSIFLMAFFVMHSPSLATSEPLVSGRYLSATGNDIVLSITIDEPAPSNLIIEQYLPPGQAITAISPPAKKVLLQLGQIKWLFHKIRAGDLVLRVKTIEPVVNGGARAVLRYRSPEDGEFREIYITP